jgi:DNA-binding NtrC family response regulator
MEDIQRAVSEGASEFMVKPFAPDDLVSTVAKMSEKTGLNIGA